MAGTDAYRAVESRADTWQEEKRWQKVKPVARRSWEAEGTCNGGRVPAISEESHGQCSGRQVSTHFLVGSTKGAVSEVMERSRGLGIIPKAD